MFSFYYYCGLIFNLYTLALQVKYYVRKNLQAKIIILLLYLHLAFVTVSTDRNQIEKIINR